MRIQKGQVIAGFPAIKVRDMFRGMEYIDADDLRSKLGVAQKAASKVLGQLVVEGYLKPEKDRSSHRITDLGCRLRCASAGPTLSRKKADELLKNVLERAKQVRENPEFACYVSRITVFGSYLDESKQELGDLDLALDIKLKPGVTPEAEQAQNAKDMENGRSFSNICEQVCWQTQKVRLFLKNKQRGVSLHDAALDRAVFEGKPVKVFNFE